MAFTPANAPDFEKKDSGHETFRFLERFHNWRGQDWHFRLLEKLTPHEVYAVFSQAKLIENTMWFDGNSKRGVVCFEWTLNRCRNELASTFGNIRVALAAKGEVQKSFKAYFTDKHQNAGQNGYITADEMTLMMELSKRALAGQKVDGYAELAAHRQARNA